MSTHSDTEFGAYLRALREKRGPWLSVPRLAGLVGVHRTLINKIEGGQRRATADFLQRVAPHLGVAPEVLLERGGFHVVLIAGPGIAAHGEVGAATLVAGQPATDVEQVTAALMRLGWPPEVKAAHAQLLRVADAAIRADADFQARFTEAVEWASTAPLAALTGTLTEQEARAVFVTQVQRRLFGDARTEK